MRESQPPVALGTDPRGHALVIAVMLMLLLATLAVTMVGGVVSGRDENLSTRLHLQRFYLAESGLDAAIADLSAGGTGALGSAGAPRGLGPGFLWTEVEALGGGLTGIRAHGVFDGDEWVVRGCVRRVESPFHHAVFAGNSSNDPTYTLTLAGEGTQADVVNGNVYSGGDVEVLEDASVNGDLVARGTIAGTTGTTGISGPGFDFSGLELTGPDVVDVAAEFSALGAQVADDAGGTADQLPATSPAHILRRNPSDRVAETSGTAKDDFFLEDPYEVVRVDSGEDGSNAYGVSIDDGTGEGRRVYFVDGNLWIHSHRTYSFRLVSQAGTGTQVTFVVRGNVYMSDNLFLGELERDALAIIALRDPDVVDSGNIYFGDPRFGTLSELQGYLYAENDFHELNLDASGSRTVRVLGTMSAGNHVAVERSYESGHSRLQVDWDPRLESGAVTLPLVSTQLPPARYVLESWTEAAR